MEYTVSQLAKVSGVSPRALRYYDEIGLLKPYRINESGYRLYERGEVDRLQQILFYKTMEIPLEEIGAILDDKAFDPARALEVHRQRLLDKRHQIDQLLNNIEQSIEALNGGNEMSDKEKFEGFKEALIEENEAKYGKEVREKYGDDLVNASNDKVRKMSEAGHKHAEKLGIIIKEKLMEAFDKKEVTGPLAKEIYELHREWIMCYWPAYSVEGHKGLGDMYVADDRFKAYYDDEKEGVAAYLRDIIHANAHK